MVAGVTASVALLTSSTLLAAAWITLHVALVVRVLWGVTGITSLERGIALVFPARLAWKAGLRWRPVIWACLFVLYWAARGALALR